MRSETFSTPGPVHLDLDMPAGEIEIATANTDETTVELESDSANEQVQEMVAAARIESNRRGDVFHVTVEVRTRHGVWISFSGGPDIRLGTPEMRLRIVCPAVATTYRSVTMGGLIDSWVRDVAIQDGVNNFNINTNTKRITVDNVRVSHTVASTTSAGPG